ncbi:hypothetical protein [Pontibacter sp. G13]|uniref:hypothetical protein n=1 Tax=Pontibacter sp. G13 TaxID=3074898 RepID=UPI0028898CE4|nr:hypothetical protein [Pontibacter sp. G13]WNJ18368.1 hypothetical protein RJD25_26235 [Pontibacter sp. G13]
MNILRIFSIASIVMGLLPISPSFGQSMTEPEPQISFAKEKRTLAYYVAQAELWWSIVQADMTVEEPWYQYYRACRNAHGTANWKDAFKEESPALRFGYEIVELLETHIPNTFTYHFVKGSTGGVSPEYGKHLIQAYRMNPDFEGLLADVVTYATSTHDHALRKEANERWYRNHGISSGFLDFGYNLLQSVPENAILLTAHDNDSYPVWMLQDALNIRPDVWVLNIDFFLFDGFRVPVFEEMGIPPFVLEDVNINDYEANWANVVKHVLMHHTGDRPLFISQTLAPKWYEGFEDRLKVQGLALKYTQEDQSLVEESIRLWNSVWRLDQLKRSLDHDDAQIRLDEMNLSYLPALKETCLHYESLGLDSELEAARIWGKTLTSRVPSHSIAKTYAPYFSQQE